MVGLGPPDEQEFEQSVLNLIRILGVHRKISGEGTTAPIPEMLSPTMEWIRQPLLIPSLCLLSLRSPSNRHQKEWKEKKGNFASYSISPQKRMLKFSCCLFHWFHVCKWGGVGETQKEEIVVLQC